MAGIYLHIPFCNSKCIYCGFYSVVSKTYVGKYISALEREMYERRNFFSSLYKADRTIRTLYIGGGTPSVLEVEMLDKILVALKQTFLFPSTAFSTENPDEFEFTIEVNPDDITMEYAIALKKIGVNRISMGVQSFSDTHLRWMSRRHTAVEAIKAFYVLREAGFRNISIDLIFGFPDLSMDQWKYNIERILNLMPEHISAYQLGIDADTPLEKKLKSGKLSLPSDELCAKMYAELQQVLMEGGYEQYEVSNFALSSAKENRSRHNCSYWAKVPYLGLGPGAHSYIGRHREWNFPNIISYCNHTTLVLREGENLSPQDVFNEGLMLGLRTADGVSLEALCATDPQASVFIRSILPTIEELCNKQCLIMTQSGRIKIPPEKLFVSDGIIRDLFVC